MLKKCGLPSFIKYIATMSWSMHIMLNLKLNFTPISGSSHWLINYLISLQTFAHLKLVDDVYFAFVVLYFILCTFYVCKKNVLTFVSNVCMFLPSQNVIKLGNFIETK